MSDWAEFFKDHQDYRVETYFYECRGNFTLEELYQAFRARLEHDNKMDESAPDPDWEREP